MKKLFKTVFLILCFPVTIFGQGGTPGNNRTGLPGQFLGYNSGTSGPLEIRNNFNDNINFFTSTPSSQRMTILGTPGPFAGFVGIGNGFTTPRSLLHIHDGGLSYLHVTNSATGNGANQGVRFGLMGPTQNAIVAQQTLGSNLYFSTNGPAPIPGNIKMVITPQGSVGIGAGGFTTPNNRLDVDAGDIDVNTPQRSYMIGDNSVLWHKGGASNIFVGVGAGNNAAINQNAFNTYVGNNAGFTGNGVVATNSANTHVGNGAGFNNNSTGTTFIGYNSGFNYGGGATTGLTFVGNRSGFSNVTGANDNTFVGGFAGEMNTIGDANAFFGLSAGRNSTTGNGNSFIGAAAGQNNTTHNENTYVGNLAGNTSVGDENILVGSRVGQAGVGNKNVVIGNNSNQSAFGSDENVAVGYHSTLNSTGNNFNTIAGSQSAINLAHADSNALIGYKTAFNQTGGNQNAYLGSNTGNNVTNGKFNTFIGSNADVTTAGSTAVRNAAAIGANAKVTNANHMILGDNNVNAGIGLSSDPIGPANKLEINTTAGSPYFGSANGSSGLRFRNMTSTNTATPNPGPGVLGVDGNGDVIYVLPGGATFGGLCTSTPPPLTGHYEMPLGGFNYYFTGNTLGGDAVSVGRPCSGTLRGRFNSFENFGSIITVKTIAGYFLNRNVSSNINDTTVGVFGQASGLVPSGIDNVNVGGTFYGQNARINIGVQGFAVNSPSQLIPATQNFGGRFRAAQGVTNNFGVWASAVGGGAGAVNYAGFFQGDVFVNGGANSGTGYLVASDQQFKTNIDTITNAQSILNQLKPRTFYFDTTNTYKVKFSSKKQYGLIAQDVQTVLPELVGNVVKPDEYDDAGNIIGPSVTYKNLNYNALIAILIKANQEQQKDIDSLKTKTSKQDSINSAVQAQIAALTSSVSSCCSSSAVRLTKPEELNQLNIDLSDKDIIVLNQNVPNPFAEQTTITYNIPEKYNIIQILFYNNLGQIIRVADIKTKGKGQLNVFASDLSRGMYSYSLYADGKMIDTKKMVKED